MEFFIFIILIIAFVVKQAKKSSSGSSSGNSSQSAASRAAQSRAPQSAARTAQQPAYRTAGTNPQRYSTSGNAGSYRAPFTRQGSANITRDGRVYASIDFDNTHYHAEGFDFDCCISFKGLPPGTDELAVLIASNNRHERELAKLMKERQA